jgi:Transposase DDE domain group 1
MYFRADAAFAMPEVYEFLEAEGIRYTIRLPANRVLQDKIGHLLTRPVGHPPNEVRRFHASFSYRAQNWKKPRRVVAEVEWHPGELCPRVGFIVTNLVRPAERVEAFYNHRGTCEQWIKEGKGAIKWTRLSCRSFAANAVRLQLHALAYNLGNFMRTLAMPEAAERVHRGYIPHTKSALPPRRAPGSWSRDDCRIDTAAPAPETRPPRHWRSSGSR